MHSRRRDVAEEVILQPVVRELLAPEMVDEIVKEARLLRQAHG